MKTSSKISGIRARGADLPQPVQPGRVRRAVEPGAARAVDERRIARRVAVRVERLQRVHEHAGDVAPLPQHPQRVVAHVPQRVGLARRQRIADPRLNVAPPAVIRAAEPHEVRAARVIAREPHRLHHRLGAGHVKRHLVEPGDRPQPLDVVRDDRVIGAEHRPELAHALDAAIDARLVEVVAEDVDAVGAGQVVEPVAVEVGDGHAGGRLQQRAASQVAAHEPAVLERDAVSAGELQVRDAVRDLGGATGGLGEAPGVQLREPEEAGAAARGDLLRGVVGGEEARFVVLVERHQPGDPPGEPGMPGERPVLRPRQLEPALQPAEGRGQRGCADGVEGGGCAHWSPGRNV